MATGKKQPILRETGSAGDGLAVCDGRRQYRPVWLVTQARQFDTSLSALLEWEQKDVDALGELARAGGPHYIYAADRLRLARMTKARLEFYAFGGGQ